MKAIYNFLTTSFGVSALLGGSHHFISIPFPVRFVYLSL